MGFDKHLSNQIRSGNYDAIIEGFLHAGQLYNVQSIISCVNHSIYNHTVEKHLKRLSLVSGLILGRQVSDYANAALVKLGGYTYSGNREEIIDLIKADKWFE